MFKIFFADDEPYVIEGLNIMIDWEKLGITPVGSAGDGQSAYNKITELKPDIVICDIKMPGMDGTELIKKCVEEMKDPPKFIMLSGYNELEFVKRSMRYGSKHYLLKPIDSEEITNTIETVCGEIAEEEELKSENIRLLQYVAEETFQRLLFCDRDDNVIERARFLLNVPSKDTALSLILFKLNRQISIDAAENIVDELKDFVKSSDSVVVYIGMRIITLISSELLSEQLKAIAVPFQNYCDSICICSANGVEDLKRVYRRAVSAINSSWGDIVYLADKPDTESGFEFNSNISSIVDLVLKRDKNASVCILKNDIEEMKKKRAAPEMIRGYISAMLLSMYKYSSEMNMNLEEIYDAAIRRISHTLTYDEAELLCIDLINNFADSVSGVNISDDIASTKDIIEFIDKHYMERITLTNISNAVFIQPSVISRLIKKATGMKFSEYLAQIRIKNAQRLMANTNRKITQIASDVGYNYYYYFANHFRTITGYNPSDYRRENGH